MSCITSHNKGTQEYIGWNIDFSINELNTQNRQRSQRTSKSYKIKENNCKLIDFGDKIRVNSSNFNATIFKFSKKFENQFCMFLYYYPARSIVGRVTDCRVRGLGFKSPGSILTSRTETSSLSRAVRDGGDPFSVPLSGKKKSPMVESSTWQLNSHNCSENYKTKLN